MRRGGREATGVVSGGIRRPGHFSSETLSSFSNPDLSEISEMGTV